MENWADEFECLLDNILPQEEVLSDFIQRSGNLKLLNLLLELRQRRIVRGESEKILLDFTRIYQDRQEQDIDLACSVLKKGLLVAQNCDSQLPEMINYLVNKLNNEKSLFLNLKLLSVVVEACGMQGKDFSHFANHDCLNDLNLSILSILETAPQPLTKFVIVNFLPNYLTNLLSYCPKVAESFLRNIFLSVRKTKKLEILCSLFDQFYSCRRNKRAFDLFDDTFFWLLLEDCIAASKTNYLEKQAIYLLSKSVYTLLENGPPYSRVVKLPENTIEEVERGWKNFFILLDVSNEKQLHLIQPSLQLYQSTRYLHLLWQICLHKVFLKQTHDSVIHFVVKRIFQSNFTIFTGVVENFFHAINRNEYSYASNEIFAEINRFSCQLSNVQFEFIVEQSLKFSWSPVALWCFYSSIFTQDTKSRVSIKLFDATIKKLKSLPNVYIREGSIKLISDYFFNNFDFDSILELQTVSRILLNINRSSFAKFIALNGEKIVRHNDELKTELEAVLCSGNIEKIEVLLKIFQALLIQAPKSNAIPSYDYSQLSDLLHSHLYFGQSAARAYLEQRLGCVEDVEDVSNLLLLSQKVVGTSTLLSKAIEILETSTNSYSNNSRIVAFTVVVANYTEQCAVIVDAWQAHLLQSSKKTDDRLVELFVKLLFKFCFDDCGEKGKIEGYVDLLENIVDSQSDAVLVIFENVSNIIKYTNNAEISCNFLRKCFTTVLQFAKNHLFKRTAGALLDQVLTPEVLKHDSLNAIVCEFIQELFKLPNFTSIANTLSEKIACLTSTNPDLSTKFISAISELLFHGIITTKAERTEYFVNEDISRKIETNQSNPNLEGATVRFHALDAILNLIKIDGGDAVASQFVSILVEKYTKYFNKRYFPQSQIHLQKLRLLQALLLIHPYIENEKPRLISLIIESFSVESHQPSIRHLMQLLLIRLLKDDDSRLTSITDKLQTINNSRPSSVACFIPVLYHLALDQEGCWDEIVNILVPCTMGPQFKLRVFSQVAILKLYEDALEKSYSNFVNNYKFLYNSVKAVVESSGDHFNELVDINKDFLDYFCLENVSCSTIYYEIPKKTGVTVTEWGDLHQFATSKIFKNFCFNHCVDIDNVTKVETNKTCEFAELNENIQKKITPWRDILEDSSNCLNDFILVTSLVEKPANLGGLSRTCEVFGVKQLVMRTSKISSDKEFKSLSMSSENWVEIMEVKVEDLRGFILDVKTKGYSVVGAEQTSESEKLGKFCFPKRTVLVLGNEKGGIPPELIPTLDHCVEIPQFGVVRSLNVHVAGAIVMWEYCKQHLL